MEEGYEGHFMILNLCFSNIKSFPRTLSDESFDVMIMDLMFNEASLALANILGNFMIKIL